jgi:hypothetical protein
LLGFLFDRKHGSDTFLRNVGELHRTTRRSNPEDRTFHSHRCDNPKSYNVILLISISSYIRVSAIFFLSFHSFINF